MHIEITDLTLCTNALIIAAILVYLQSEFYKLSFIKDRCKVQIAVLAIIVLLALIALLIQYEIEMIRGAIGDSWCGVIVVLLIIAVLALLILQHGLPFYKKAKFLPILKKLKAIIDKVKAGEGESLSEAEKKELQEDADKLLKEIDDVKVDPKDFSEDDRKMIKELIKTLEE